MRSRATLLVAAMVVALVAGSGVALAELIYCDNTPPCWGTSEDDQIKGTSKGETIHASWNDDTVYGYGGNDTLIGAHGFDTIYGGGGSDEIDVEANPMTDPPGDDGEVDHAYGGRGNDEIYARDGSPDVVDCGGGSNDFVERDLQDDTLKNCEVAYPWGPL